MADTTGELVIRFKGEEVGVLSNIERIVKGLESLEKSAQATAKKVNEETKKIKKSFDEVASQIQGVSNKISNTLKPMSSMIGKVGSIVGVTGLTGVIYKSVDSFKSLQKNMKEVSTLIKGDATPQIEAYTKAVRKMAIESGKSTADLTKGIYQIVSAGVKGSETIEGTIQLLNVAQQAATAGVSDTFTSVDMLTTVLNAYGKSTADAQHFADILFTSVRLGKTTFNQLAGSIGVVAAGAAGSGIKFEELNAAVVACTKSGLSTDMAMTSLNSLFMKMLDPSENLTNAVQGLGKGYKTVYDLMKKEGLLGLFETLGKLTGGDTQKLQALIPEIRALRSASILSGTGLEALRGTMAEFKNTAGASAEAYGKMAKGTSYELGKLKQRFEEVFYAIGEQIMPKLMEALKEFSKWFEKNSKTIIDSASEIVKELMRFFSYLIQNGETIVKIFGAIWVTEKLAVLASGITKVTLALKGLNMAMLAMGGKVAVVLAGIAAVAYGIDAINDRSKELRKSENEGPKAKGMPKWRQDELAAQMGWREKGDAGNVKNFPEESADVITGNGKQAQQNIAELTAEEKKQRAKALAELHKLEVSYADDLQKLWLQFEDQRAEWTAKEGISAEERELALASIEKEREEKLTKAYKDREDKERKWLQDKNTVVQKAEDELLEMRAAAREKESIKMQQAADYVSELQLKLMSGAEQLEHAFREDLKKIDAMQFQDPDQYKKAIELRTQLFQKEQAGMTSSIMNIFTGSFWNGVAEGFAHKVGADLEEFAKRFADILTTPLSALGDVFSNLMGGMNNIASKGLGKITEIFNSILSGDAGKDKVKEMTEMAVAFFETLAQQLPSALEWFAREGVPRIIQAFVDSLPDVIDALVEAIPIILNSIISKLDKIILPLVAGILKVIPKIIEQIPLLITKIAEMIPQIIVMIVKALPSIIGSIGKGLVESVGGFFKGLATGIVDAFTEKSKAEKAREAKQKTIKEALAQGKTQQEAEALGEAAYEKEMGRLYEGGEDLARLEYNRVYKETQAGKGLSIDEGRELTQIEAGIYGDKRLSWEDRKKKAAEARKKYLDELALKKAAAAGDAVLGAQGKGREEVIEDLAQSHGGYGGSKPLEETGGKGYAETGTPTSGEGVRTPEAADAYYGPPEKPEEYHAPVRDPKEEAQKAYDEKLKELLAKIDADWAVEAKFLMAKGITGKKLEKERKDFYEQAKELAYEAARAAYNEMLEKVKIENRQNPEYDWAGTMHSGGYIDTITNMAKAFRAHSGVSIPGGLAPDEVPIIAQAGEAVMNRNWVRRAGGKQAIDQMNATGQAGSGVVNNVYVEHMMSNDTAKVIDGMLSDNLRSGAGKLYEKLNSGRAVGYKTRRAS
jgi:TP901 family phage tail tape measure protein